MHYHGLSDETVRTMIGVARTLEDVSGRTRGTVSWGEVTRHIVGNADHWSRTQAMARMTPGGGVIGLRASQLASAARDLSREDRRPRPARASR